LIPTDAPAREAGPLRDVPIDHIVPNTYQPRQVFEDEALDALAASIAALGVLQPILVRESSPGRYELIAGERRWRAAARAGLDHIPAIIRDVDDETSLAHAIVENVQRAELNAIEEASAFRQLIDDFSLTQDEVASRVGRSRPAVANSLRLLQLPVDVQRLIIDGRLSAGHGRVLVSVDDDERSALVDRILTENLSVRALEALSRDGDDAEALAEPTDRAGAAGADGGVGTTKPPALLELEELLGERFDTKVAITLGAQRGRLSIEFADIDDLERIYALMTG
jgi:ParB family chromosome partitioning protein